MHNNTTQANAPPWSAAWFPRDVRVRTFNNRHFRFLMLYTQMQIMMFRVISAWFSAWFADQPLTLSSSSLQFRFFNLFFANMIFKFCFQKMNFRILDSIQIRFSNNENNKNKYETSAARILFRPETSKTSFYFWQSWFVSVIWNRVTAQACDGAALRWRDGAILNKNTSKAQVGLPRAPSH